MKEHSYFYKTMRFIFSPLFKFIYRPEIIGKENIPDNGAVVIAGNHKHALDPILVDISTKRIIRTLAKKELHDGPFGFIFKMVKSIPVDLHSSKNREALYTAIEELKKGQAVNVSPEAKRNYTNELLLPFKYGAVSMASKSNAPLIPYAIAGDYKLFSKNLKIIFGSPFYVEDDLTKENERLYNTISELLYKISDEKIINKKHFTPFNEWSNKNEKTT